MVLFSDSELLRTSTLGSKGFLAFSKAFLLVNGHQGRLTHYSSATTVNLVDSDLDGLDPLWGIALEVDIVLSAT